MPYFVQSKVGYASKMCAFDSFLKAYLWDLYQENQNTSIQYSADCFVGLVLCSILSSGKVLSFSIRNFSKVATDSGFPLDDNRLAHCDKRLNWQNMGVLIRYTSA